MRRDYHPSPTSIAYARAILELATEAGNAVSVGWELDALRQVLVAVPQLVQILADPAISTEERSRLLHTLLAGRASKLVFNFLLLTNEKGRLNLLSQIADAYDELLDQQRGKIEVDVTVAHRLSDADLESVRQKVGSALERDAVVHQFVDESIIGGLILRVQDKLIDGSVKAQLALMRQKLLSGKPV